VSAAKAVCRDEGCNRECLKHHPQGTFRLLWEPTLISLIEEIPCKSTDCGKKQVRGKASVKATLKIKDIKPG
jgi:hypothetical protein